MGILMSPLDLTLSDLERSKVKLIQILCGRSTVCCENISQ